MTGRSVEVKIELGHKAVLKEKPTDDGYTHDWTVFVRGPEGCRIENFVEKVIFQLHESFPKSKRTIREPPFQVSESGYAGFNMPVWVYFKTKEDPKKLEFIYDLYLSLDWKPINNIRCEKLTFHNPPDDFWQKLLKGGGSFKVQSSSPGKKPPTPPQKKSPSQNPAALLPPPPPAKPFLDIFANSIVKQPEPKLEKKEKRKEKRDKDYKKEKKREDRKDGKDIRNAEKPIKEKVKSELLPPPEIIKKEERAFSVKDEKKRHDSSPPERSVKLSPGEDKEAKRKKKKSSSSSSHKDSPDPKKPKIDESSSLSNKTKKKSPSKECLASPLTSEPMDDGDLSFTPSPTYDSVRKRKSSPSTQVPESRKEIRQQPSPLSQPPPHSLPPPPLPGKAIQPKKSSVSPPEQKRKTKSGGLAAMLSEYENDDHSSPEPQSVTEVSADDRRRDRLSLLKRKILKLNDDKLQQVVDIIEETGKFVLSEESFDFDLRKIDAPTISRIQQLVT